MRPKIQVFSLNFPCIALLNAPEPIEGQAIYFAFQFNLEKTCFVEIIPSAFIINT